MIKSVSLCVVVIAGLTTMGSFAGDSTKDALRVLDKRIGAQASSQVVRILGWNGEHQPDKWHFLLRDAKAPNAFHEYTVEGRQIVAHRFYRNDYVQNHPGTTMPMSSVLLDSRDIFAVADRAAKQAGVGFDTINYELRCKELSRTPVWYVDIRDQNYNRVGRLSISAKDGTIMQKVWYGSGPQAPVLAANFPGPPPAPYAPMPR